MNPNDLPDPSTPAWQDKHLWLIVASLISTLIAKFLGANISTDQIMQWGAGLIAVYTVISKWKSAKVSQANAAALAVSADAGSPKVIATTADGTKIVQPAPKA